MSQPNSIAVDVTNPGQFFACCGLLELADRYWKEEQVHAHFGNEHFCIQGAGKSIQLEELLDRFANADLQQLDPSDKAASPLVLGKPFDLRLDWWCKLERAKVPVDSGGGDRFKTWAGQQSAPSIFKEMKQACRGLSSRELFNEPKAVYDVKDGKSKKKTISPFYFDSRRSESSLDIGFSPDEQQLSVMVHPAVEAFAFVGLQRFRALPSGTGANASFQYVLWAEPMHCSVAQAAGCGLIPVKSCGTFRFTKPSRGGEYVTMFSRAQKQRSSNDRK